MDEYILPLLLYYSSVISRILLKKDFKTLHHGLVVISCFFCNFLFHLTELVDEHIESCLTTRYHGVEHIHCPSFYSFVILTHPPI